MKNFTLIMLIAAFTFPYGLGIAQTNIGKSVNSIHLGQGLGIASEAAVSVGENIHFESFS